MGIIAKRTIFFHLCMHAAIRMMQQFVELTGVGCQHILATLHLLVLACLLLLLCFLA